MSEYFLGPNEWEQARNKEQDPFMQDGELWMPVIGSFVIPDGEVGERQLDQEWLKSKQPKGERVPYSPC